MAALFPDMNVLDFSTWNVLLVKAQVIPHTNLASQRPSITTEWFS
jgi:hypothetical protein